MLTNKTLEIASRLSNTLTYGGYRVSASNLTPLHVLVEQMQPILNPTDTEVEVQELIRGAALPVDPTYDAHTAELRVLVDMLEQRVSNNFSFARNQIKPLIADIVEEIQKVQGAVEAALVTNKQVMHLKVSPILKNTDIENLYKRFAIGDYPTTRLSASLRAKVMDELTPESLMGALTKNKPFLKDILKGEDIRLDLEGRDLMGELFSPLTEVTVISRPVMTGISNILTFLYLDAVLANRVDTIDYETIDLEERTEISKVMAYYGNLVNRQISTIVDFSNTRNFIVDYDTNVISVYDRNYQVWLEKEEACSVEALIGFTIYGSNNRLPEASLHNAPAHYVERYNDTLALESTKQSVVSIREISQLLHSNIRDAIDEWEWDEEEKTTARIGLSDFTKANPLQVDTEIVNYVKRAVCSIFGKHTHAEQILSDVDKYMAENDAATYRKAAVVAAARIVAKWMAGQVVIAKADEESRITEL